MVAIITVFDTELNALISWNALVKCFFSSFYSFYEWQEVKGDGPKQPYFIYFKEKIKDEENNEVNESKEKPPLLSMAGIFDVWKSPSV